MALDHSRGRIRRAGGLLNAIERSYVLHQAPRQPLIPTHPIDVNGVGLRGVNSHVESNVSALVDAGCGGITFDLAYSVRRREAGDLPLARPGLLVLDHDRIALSRRRGGKQ